MIIVDQSERCGKWLAEKQNLQYCKDESAVYIGLERKGKLNVVIMYNNFIPNGSIHAHIAVKGKGNKEILFKAFDYPFNQLNVKKIIGIIQTTNKKSINLAYKLGFNLEYVVNDAGVNCDLLIFSMTKKQCKYLNKG